MNPRGSSSRPAQLCGRCGGAHGGDAASCPALLVGRTLAGRFHVVRLIGAGGTAAVYKAQNLAIGRFVAVKVMHPHLRSDPQAVERFVREGRAMSRVRHEGVVDVLDLVTTEDGALMLVMEYVRGRTLAAEIKRAGAFTLVRAMDLAGQLLATLSAIHERGLVHRDLKPSNLLAGVDARRRERLKVADFGLALDTRAPRRGGLRVRVTPRGRVLATPRYLAPELLRGGDGADPRADVYGAGLVIYEMLAGRPAFGAADIDELADAILNSRPPSVAAARGDVPAPLDEVVARALSKFPGERFPNAYAMLDALRPFGAATEVVEAEPTDSLLIEMPRPPRGSIPPRPRVEPPAALAPNASVPAEDAPEALLPPPPEHAPNMGGSAHPHSIFPRPTAREADSTQPRAALSAERAGELAPPPLPRGDLLSGSLPAFDAALLTTGRVRGVLAATLLDALRRRYGEPAVGALIAELQPAVREAYTGPIRADAWLPGGVLTTLLEAADDRLGRGDGALCIGFGRVAGHAILPGAQSRHSAIATPESALIEAGSLWRRYFEMGELRIPAVGRGYGKLVLRGNNPRRSTCLATAGFMEVLLELAGCRDVEIAIPTCRALGDATCSFDASWIV